MPSNAHGAGSSYAMQYETEEKTMVTVAGTSHIAKTARGNRIRCWKALPGETNPLHTHFCHGHALGTFDLDKYTVFSDDVYTLLTDEYHMIGYSNSCPGYEAKDVLAWTQMKKGTSGYNVAHSALVLTTTKEANPIVTSKTGWEELKTTSATEVATEYKLGTYEIWRRGPAAESRCVIL